MDQVKEYLKVAIKYRFWIVVAIASLLPLIGYFATAGSIQEEETKKQAEIKSAFDEVNKFASNSRPVNNQYKPLVEAKTDVLKKDVDVSWRKLYALQAPLLTWPQAVVDSIPKWGRKWPEQTDPTVVNQAITDYVETYTPFVKEVYQTFKPFDPETGEGIVAAPPYEILLRPSTFTIEKLPSLGKVWAAQERLWIQRTVLDVIAKVNEKAGAKDWSSAVIKQILALEVANPAAQDQQSTAKGETLKEAPEIAAPGSETAAAEPAAAESAPGLPGMGGDMMNQMPGMAGGMEGSMGMGMGMNPGAEQKVMFLESPNPDQVFIVPFKLAVYVEQEHIPDLLVEFRNSPMNIQVLEFEMYKPVPHSVKKPEKGEGMAFYGEMGGMPGMPGGRGGYGMMQDMMMGGYGMPGMAGMDAGYGASQMESMAGYGMPGMAGMEGMGGMGPAKPKRGSVEVRQQNIAKLKEARDKGKDEDTKKKDQRPESKITDPYYNVVEVRVYGTARFYKAPPEKEETPESQSAESVAAEGASPDANAAESAEPATPGEPAAPANATEPAPSPPANADAAPAEAPKAEPAKGEPAPAEAPKAEPAKGEPAPAETPKAEPANDQASPAPANHTEVPKG